MFFILQWYAEILPTNIIKISKKKFFNKQQVQVQNTWSLNFPLHRNKESTTKRPSHRVARPSRTTTTTSQLLLLEPLCICTTKKKQHGISSSTYNSLNIRMRTCNKEERFYTRQAAHVKNHPPSYCYTSFAACSFIGTSTPLYFLLLSLVCLYQNYY